MNKDVYHSIAATSEGSFKDRGSRFLAYAFPVENENEVREHIKNLKKEHHSARHHCYAFRIGAKEPAFRSNDDGEPSGTAGRPIYGQILSRDLTNILIVVVRYFGGTKLGTSGLINAYRSAAEECLEQAKIIDLVITKSCEIRFDYELLNPVMRIVDEEETEIMEKDFTESCRMILNIRESEFERVTARMAKLPGIQLII